MGRPRKLSGATKIAKAEQLFRQSMMAGTPDYEYIALAIGERPFDPPDWAMLECIELHSNTIKASTRGNDNATSRHAMRQILDKIIRFYIAAELKHERITGVSVWSDDVPEELVYKRPSFSHAVISACRSLKTRENEISRANTDWHRDVRVAWEYEQSHEHLPQRVAGSRRFDESETYFQLFGWKTTVRIDRVMSEWQEKTSRVPANLSKALWLADKLRD